MKIKKIKNRSVLFTFEELNVSPFYCITNVLVIVGKNRYYICDTYLGESYMNDVKRYLEENYGIKEYVVFNSHAHWDHIWGNCAFKNSKIIAHEKCRAFIRSDGETYLEHHKKQFAKDNVEIVLPNETFSEYIAFDEDDLVFFYSPGHSEDAASCFDDKEKILFVGDNIDAPIPSFFDWEDLNGYIRTLEKYLTYEPEYVIQSHGDVMPSEIIDQNIQYLRHLIEGKPMSFESEEVVKKHKNNVEFVNEIKSHKQ